MLQARRLFPACAIVACLALTASAESRIAWRLPPGRTLRYRVDLDQKSTQRSGAYAFETRQRFGADWTLVVEDVEPDGTARLRLRYDAVRVDLDLMTSGRLQWDSSKREDRLRAKDPTVRPYAVLVGSEIRFAMRPDGTVVPGSLRGLEPLRTRLAAELGGGAYVEATLLPMLADEAVRADLETAFRIGPPGPVVPGAHWQHEIVRPAATLGALRLVRTCRLERLDEQEAEIALAVGIEAAPAAAGADRPAVYAASRVELLEGGGSGKARFSIAEGRLLETQLELRMRLRAGADPGVTALDQAQAGAPVQVQVEQRVHVEALD